MDNEGTSLDDLFTAKSVTRIWDLFNAMPFNLKTRILFSGIMCLVYENLSTKTTKTLFKCLVKESFLSKHGGTP